MKRAYLDMAPPLRHGEALDEAFFDLPDGRLRSTLLAALRRQTPASDPSSVAWLAARGLRADGAPTERSR